MTPHDFKHGLVRGSDADRLNEIDRKVGRIPDAASVGDRQWEETWVKLTASDGGTPPTYSGTEQYLTGPNTYADRYGGRTFSPTGEAIYERNGLSVPSFPWYALIRRRPSFNGVPAWEFDLGGQVAPAAALVVQTADGTTKHFTGITTLEVPTAQANIISNPSPGVAEFDLSQAVTGCRLTSSTNQFFFGSFPFGTNVTFDTEVLDTNGFHDNVTNNDRITIPTGFAGLYLIGFRVSWLDNTSPPTPYVGYDTVVEILLNGTRTIADSSNGAYIDSAGTRNGQPQDEACIVWYLNDGDYITLNAAASGQPGEIVSADGSPTSSNYSPIFFAIRLTGTNNSGTSAGNLTVGSNAIVGSADGRFLTVSSGLLADYTPAAADAALGTAVGALTGTFP